MDAITLDAQPRGVGKKGARAARRDGHVPCVLYGSHVDPVVFQVPEKTLKPLIYTDETHIVTVQLNSDAWECILKDIAFHPVTDRPLHADFQVLQAGEKVTLSVPVRYLGTPVGQTEGGRTSLMVNELEVSCLPKDIPSHIDVDVSHVGIGEAIHISEVSIEGVEFNVPDDLLLMSVLAPRLEVVEEEEGVEGLLEGEEGEEMDEEAEEDEG